jgi:2-polyprenyl-6-methoxyphenol hydroxylase-like FAD-dependent oxidoreductase
MPFDISPFISYSPELLNSCEILWPAAMSRSRSAVIVGAGIGGLAAALALRRADWDVRVVEHAATPRELGFAVALAPNALDALGELGLRDAVMARGVEVKAFELRRMDGRVRKRVDLHGDAVQSLVLLRPALHGTLLDAVGRESLLLGCRVTGVGSRSSIQALEFENRDLTPGVGAADVVVGADGVGSVIRKALHPLEAAPRPSGYSALRGVSYHVGDRLGTADAAVYFGDGVEIGFARASADAVYWYISLVDELAAADPAATLDRCLRGLHDEAAAIARAATPENIRPDRLWYRDPISHWGRGAVTLLGDAAHPVLPHTAQGAALALEDAVALGLVLAPSGLVEPALRRYEQVRATRTRAVVRTGPRIAAMTTTRRRSRLALREALIRVTPARALSLALTRHARDPHRRLRG